MAQAPAPTKHAHDEPAHKEPAKAVDRPLILPEAEARGEPLVGARGVKGEHIEDGERDPDTIAEEQRRRSAEYEANLAAGRSAAHSSPPKK